MLIACWSPKGGTGTTVFSAALALTLAGRLGPGGSVVLADLAGDLPAALGVPDPDGPGLHDWLTAGADVPDRALAQLETDAGPRLRLLAAGGTDPAAPHTGDPTPADAERGDVLAGILAADARPVVADCGSAAAGAELALAAGATLSILVVRPCYLALRRALAAPTRPSGAVLVAEPGRSLARADVEDVLGVPVFGQVPYDVTVARAVDAGLLGSPAPATSPRPVAAHGRRPPGAAGSAHRGREVPARSKPPAPAGLPPVNLPDAKTRVHARLLASGRGAHDASGRGAGPAALPDVVARLVDEEAPLLSDVLRNRLTHEVLADVAGLGPLEPLLSDSGVTDVMINGPGPVWVERRGVLERLPIELETAAIEHLLEKVVAPLGLRVDRASPLVDARLPDGSRVNAVVPPLAVDGPCLTIRRFAARPLPLATFASPPVAELLSWAVRARLNVVVSGGTGAGKTTLLNALAACIPPRERVVTVEDAAELRLPGEHVVRLEARPANAEGVGEVRVRQLVRNALRMRPDRILVGEVRGPEALDMLQAMNTGHEGSLSTCHANSPDDTLRRLETMVLMGEVALPLAAVRAQLESALDLVVQVTRGVDGSRRVTQVAEVIEGTEAGRARTRPLVESTAVVALPARPPRAAGAAAPDPSWIGPGAETGPQRPGAETGPQRPGAETGPQRPGAETGPQRPGAEQ